MTSSTHDSPVTLRVLTFNLWSVSPSDHSSRIILNHITAKRGLKYVSKNRSERVSYFGDLLATGFRSLAGSSSPSNSFISTDGVDLNSPNGEHVPLYDVVCLQEVWVEEDIRLLKRRAREGGLGYARWFRSYVYGCAIPVMDSDHLQLNPQPR
jgi:hypothetical protein